MEYTAFILEIGIGVTMIVFGVHQLLHPRDWLQYLPAWLGRIVAFKPTTVLKLHAAGNIILAVLLVSTFQPLIVAWIAFIWLLTILPNSFKVRWDIGLRDLSITFAAAALISLLSI